jgi:hypothetical protein
MLNVKGYGVPCVHRCSTMFLRYIHKITSRIGIFPVDSMCGIDGADGNVVATAGACTRCHAAMYHCHCIKFERERATPLIIVVILGC